MKQIQKKPDVKAISLDGIDTTAAWRVECEEPVMEAAPHWLEEEDIQHDTEALDEDVPLPEDFHTEYVSVPPSEPQSTMSEIDRSGASTSSGGGLGQILPVVPSSLGRGSSVSRGHHSAGSSSRGRGRQSPVRPPRAPRAPTPSSRGRAISTAITFTCKRGRGNR